MPENMSERDLNAVRQKAADFFEVYTRGTFDEYVTFLAGLDQTPTTPLAANPSLWVRDREAIGGSPLRPTEAVLLVKSNGSRVADDWMGSARANYKRSRAFENPELDPVQNRLTSLEAVVPIQASNTHGGTFDAYLGATFVYDPDTRTWKHAAITLYGVPLGIPIHHPPL